MPTYDYKCSECGLEASVVQTISAYSALPIRPQCHGEMQRKLSVTPGMSGLANALAGDRHYDGLQTTDGVDISTRTKHREYMKSKGLTIASDYTETWKKAAEQRQAFAAGTHSDPDLRRTVTELVEKAVQS